MFEEFGEFDSAEEINRKAEELLQADDREGLRRLAEENGIDPSVADDYAGMGLEKFVSPLLAAMGKLQAESMDLELDGILEEWHMLVLSLCNDDKGMSLAVRKKGKSLKDCIVALVTFSFDNKVQVSDKIVNDVIVNHNGKAEPMRKPLYLGVPNTAQAKQIIRDYYMQ